MHLTRLTSVVNLVCGLEMECDKVVVSIYLTGDIVIPIAGLRTESVETFFPPYNLPIFTFR